MIVGFHPRCIPALGIIERLARSGGCRKLRWSRPGMGKQGGVRVIYFSNLDAGELCMLLVYSKATKDNIPGYILKEIRKEIENDRS